ncbi:hypothetical protein HU200_034770 [Digitaria exilis]|uniref:Uncharacterized protein n=1 Tax=Digitaria exilis TaxID=1010633 RepID=A0A835EMA4_9POAL|nr:hypothetical protein HU200_034770 [Digitaria exilis]
MDPPPTREEAQPESCRCPDADDPETSRPERDDPETSRSERGDRAPPPPLRQQIVGACRADERIRPLLTLNVSCTAADDRFIAHLAQHFEVSEVGMLARCLCIPLVSLRVGKVQRDGTLLCPTHIRGKLNLGLLPSSSMCLTFVGDDGYSEQLALLSNGFEFLEVAIEEISADNSGRCFLVRISESKVFYYWCAEKSKEHGIELLTKMKNFLDGRPTLSDLTGISKSRLDAFATHLHAYLLASSIGDVKSLGPLNDSLGPSRLHVQYSEFQSAVSKTSRFRASATNATKSSSIYQTSLSPRSGTFKDGVPRSLCSRVVGREKLKRRVEWSSPSTAPPDANHLTSNSINPDSTIEQCDADCSRNIVTSMPLDLPISFPLLPSVYSLGTCPPPEVSMEKQFKPYYCWCPPCPSSLQYTVTPLHLPATAVDPLPLPTLSSLLSNEQPSSLAVSAELDRTDLPSLNLPSILHDPLVHLPLPTSPLIPLHGSQVPTFTPLMSDPIVHIPVIDVCSAGQAYLVSCGPSSAVPLLPSLKPLLPEADSLVERSARETLMRLIASTPSSNPQLANILPMAMPESVSRPNNVNKNVDAEPKDKGFSTSVFGNGIGGAELHSGDAFSSGDDSQEPFAEYDNTTTDCDVQHCQKI